MCVLNHLSSFMLLPSPIGFMPQEKVTTNDHFKIQKMIRGHTQPLKEKSCPRLPTPKDKQQWQPSKINLQTRFIETLMNIFEKQFHVLKLCFHMFNTSFNI